MYKEITCIVCPNGCELTIETQEDEIMVCGNLCSKGKEYAIQEIKNPKRTIASLVKVINGVIPLVSVRTTKAIPKKEIFNVLEEIKKIERDAPVKSGNILIRDVLGLKSDIIATKSVDKKNK
ncbi:DUF1667 domain-containing protein [Clostridium rectalis]|uniref:DUF1667 domain-containing protein n=1 Tax=Clostridium rectalis TaxID=2040295 RepID=UPI000F633267|nr:DUF1667 domain-containing protein [Clostridium rectalis]